MTKRSLALLLCLALCLSLIPAAAAGDIDVSDEPEELAEKTPEALPGEEIALDEPGEPGDEIGVIDPEKIAIPDEPEKTTPSQDAPAKTAPGPDAEIQASVVTSGDCGDTVTWTLYDDGRLELSGSGETYGYPGEFPDFYSYKDQCKTLVVGDGITLLGTYLFYGMSSLSSATLGKDVSSINLSCFAGCSALTEIRFKGHAPESIASTAFNNVNAKAYYYPLPDWTSDKRQNYGGTLTWRCDNKVGDDVYWWMQSDGYWISIYGSGSTWDFPYEYPGFYAFRDEIEDVAIESGVTRLGEYLLYGMSSMEYLRLYPGVQEIGKGSINYCYALDEVDFAGHAPNFTDPCFNGTTATAYYRPWTNGGWTSDVMQAYGGTITWECRDHMGDNVTWTITDDGLVTVSGSGPTWDRGGGVNTGYALIHDLVTGIVVNEGVTTLGRYEFWYSDNLETVELPSSLTAIGVEAFEGCPKLTSMEIPYKVSTIDYGAFSDCSALTEIRFMGHAPTSIASNAFYNVTATAHYYPVYSWTSDKLQQYNGTLTWVCDDKVGDNVKWKLDEDGTLTLSGTGATWDWFSDYPGFYYFSREVTSAVVGEGVTELGIFLFWEMDKLNKVSLPSTLTKVGSGAFCYCSSLPSITIPASVTVIRTLAFEDCSALSEIRFLGSAPSIGNTAFQTVTATAYYPSDDPSWTEDVRQQYGATKLTWMPYTPMTLNGDAISATLPVHDSMSLVVKDSGGTFVTDASWSTSDPNVATVDENGVITAVKYGKCTITASTDGGINTAECALQTLFWDVADSSKYYFKHVYWAAEKGITKGYDLEYFDPQGTCTREQMMTFLWRLAGQPKPKTTSSPFPDVKSGAYYYKAVLWGVEKKITAGFSEGEYAGKFGVGLPCTREQAMTFLWRMAGKPNPKSLTTKFSDVKSSDYFFKAVLWAAENGIANGYADGTYGVGLDCLREHMVTFLSRYASKFM